jgi:hypothetical protein
LPAQDLILALIRRGNPSGPHGAWLATDATTADKGMNIGGNLASLQLFPDQQDLQRSRIMPAKVAIWVLSDCNRQPDQ